MTTERRLDVNAEDMIKLLKQNKAEDVLTPLGGALLKIIVLDRMLTEREEAAILSPSLTDAELNQRALDQRNAVMEHRYTNGERVFEPGEMVHDSLEKLAS